jgi:hypothetical protein
VPGHKVAARYAYLSYQLDLVYESNQSKDLSFNKMGATVLQIMTGIVRDYVL